MTGRWAEEERLGTQAVWRNPNYMRSETRGLPTLDAAMEAGAKCALCEAPLRRYPLVEAVLGGEILLMHAECAEDVGRSLLDDVGVIGAGEDG